jgi:hypothetical protein
MTRADLPKINYASNGPESTMLETWDYGKSWRVLTGNRTAGDIRFFSLDPRDNDTVWVALSRALVKIQRSESPPKKKLRKLLSRQRLQLTPVLPDDPSLSQVMLATLQHTRVGIDTMTEGLDRLRSRKWLPDRINVGVRHDTYRIGRQMQDILYPGDKILQVNGYVEWVAMAWATWKLPDIAYRQDSAAMARYRVLSMNDHVRSRMIHGVHRNYGELQRLKAQQAHGGDRELYTRVMERVRIDYLEAVVDLLSGGYLTRWKKKAR